MKYGYAFFVNVQQDAEGHWLGFLGYADGHKLELAYQGGVDVPSHLSTPEACMKAGCDLLFEEFNINHPADYRNRSMSVGDVIVLSNGIAYACLPIGWEEVPLPTYKPL